MANAESVKSKIQNLIATANATTGKADANMSDAVASLIAGFRAGENSSSLPVAWGIARWEARPLGEVLTFTVPATAEYFLFFIAEQPDYTTGDPFLAFVMAMRSNGLIISCGSNSAGSSINTANGFLPGTSTSYFYGAYFDGPTVSMYPADSSSNYRKTPQAGKNYMWMAW